ncbi:hypothetical protein BGZ76_006407 [Entomortierella beljakovae]|nr:hypothetical protein BGZ76_006407 [Entomortierella beljakovae]
MNTSPDNRVNDRGKSHDPSLQHQSTDSAPLKHTQPSHNNQQSHTSTTGHGHHHSHSNSTHPTSNPNSLFHLVNIPNRLVLDNVYLNGLHSLRRFGIKNVSQSDILVKMRSSLGSQISFQLTNENLPFDPDSSESTLQTISTNTAAAAEAGSSTATGHQFNQLFNHVNLIDEVSIPAGETEYVILGFLPEARGRNRRGKWDQTSAGQETLNVNSGNGSTHGDSSQNHDDSRQRDLSANGLVSGSNVDIGEFDDADQQTDSFDSFEVNGLLFFFAYKVNSATTESKTDHENDASQLSIAGGSLANSPPSIHGFPSDIVPVVPSASSHGGISQDSSTLTASQITTTAPHKADYQQTVKFRSSVCRSVLYSNIGETGINFDDCVTNQEFVKDFTIWNRSEIPLYWKLNVVDTGNTSRESWLRFVDYEDSFGGNGMEVNTNHKEDQNHIQNHSVTNRVKPIPSYGYKRIRVIFRPDENGDFVFDLQLENLNDASNIEEASIHATIRAVSRGEDTLVLSTGSTLDFGDCCAGIWTRLPITLSNTGLAPTEIHLNVEGAEAVFDIHTESSSEPTTDYTKEGTLMLDPDISSSWYESSRRSESSGNTDNFEHGLSGANLTRSRLRDWVEDGPHSPNAPGFTSSSASVSDSAGVKTDRGSRDHVGADSSPGSPVTSEGFFPENIQQINSNVEKYLASQELPRPPRDGVEEDLESEPDNSSTQDSTHVGPLINHKKRLSLRSISFSGAQRDRELAQAQLHGQKSPARGNQSTTRIEELYLKPGKDRTVIVSYRPARDSSIEDFQAGKLLRKSFRIIVSYAPWVGGSVPFSENPQRDRKIIQCKARACTSFVTIEPKILDFGDTDVTTLKSMLFKLINLSEIPATVQLDFQSKILSCSPSGAITIPSKSSTELKLDIYPRKVNPDYRKQLTLFNLSNQANDQIVEVRSTNIDKNRVTFHSLFYRVLYPGGLNFVDFGNVVVGGLSLRTLTISNFTKNWLTLKVTTSLPDELGVYERARDRKVHLNNGVIGDISHIGHDMQGVIPTSISSDDTATVSSRGASPSLIDPRTHLSAIEGSKSSLLKRRQDARDQGSATGSESGGPSIIGNNPIPSSLTLKAKAILFHSDTPQSIGNNTPAMFLDLATNRPKESKKVMMRVPTMKELLEPRPHPSNSPLGRSTKSTTTTSTDSARIQRSQGNLLQNHPSNSTEGTAKRHEGSASTTQRQHDRKSSQNDGNGQTSATINSNPFLGERSLDSVIEALDTNSANGAMLFYKPSEEELFVKERIRLTRDLRNAITSGELARASIVNVPPETEYQLIVLFTPSSMDRDHIKGIPKKQDARILLRLVDFDRETVANNPQFRALLDGDLSLIPLREIMVRSSLVRCIMDLGQNNINFGIMDKGEKRTKTIVIQNRSKEPLLYHIRKSGSIASGDILLSNGKSGVVRGYSKKEVDFIFEPSLSGPYHENLAIENVQDRDSSRTLSIKANIRKPKHFSTDTQEIDFGPCCVGKKTASKRITVTNSTKQTRTFEVRVDPHEMMPLTTESHHYGGEIEFTLEDDPAGTAVVTKEMEDEIEILEQKLKIAKRKGREDKVKKVTARLSLLRKGGVEDKPENSTSSPVESSEVAPAQEKLPAHTKGQFGAPTVETSVKSAVATTPSSATPVSTPITKEQLKFRRTDHSIVFTLDGGKTKSVTAYFTALRDQPPLATGVAEKDRLRLQGKIYVHEHKNRDICHDVMFYATVECKVPANSESTESESNPSTTIAKKKETKVKSKSNVPDARDQKDISPKKKVAFDPITTNNTPKELEPPAEHLLLSPNTFDGGRIEHGQKSTFYFTISNTGDATLPYRIVLGLGPSKNSRFVLDESELEGSLEPKAVRRITFGYFADQLGRLRDTLQVINKTTGSHFDYNFMCYSHRAQYLAFPSVDESTTLDLGYCYVDTGRKYSQVTPLLVENITDDDVYIACASNLSQQVGIYLDEQAEKGQVTKTFVKKHSMITVWVAVQPNLLSGGSSRRTGTAANGASPGSKDRDSECRTLVGGIKFTISVPEDRIETGPAASDDAGETMTQIFTQTVKFTSIIGRSNLSVSDRLLDLGWTPDVGKPVYGSFALQNMSNLLPLHFQLESLSGNIILDRTGGILDGWDADKALLPSLHSDSGDVFPIDDEKVYHDSDAMEMAPTDRSRLLISFRVTASTSGLLTDTILVTNENNCSQKIEVKVRLFVDPRHLLTNSHGQGYSCPMTLEDLTEIEEVKPGVPREGLSLPQLAWKDIHVSIHEEPETNGEDAHTFVSFQPPHGESEAHIDKRWVEFLNESEEAMELVPLCDIDVTSCWGQATPDLGEQLLSTSESKEVDGFHFCGTVVKLAPKQKIQLLISSPLPNIAQSGVESLQNGKNVSMTGNLMVLDRLKNQIVKVLGILSTFGVSYCEVDPLSVDLGKIGHYNSWEKVEFQVNVKNLSEIPFQFEIILEDYMDLSSNTPSFEESPIEPVRKRAIQGLGIESVGLTLDPKKIDSFSSGRRTFPIKIINLNNPKNEISVEVSAVLTEFELGFDRLTNGTLVLPQLMHPLPSTAQPSDTWFSITNKSSHDVRFEIDSDLSPDVCEYVQLDVLSRFSNSPLRGTISLSSRGSIEVRVRVFPKEGSRLPSDTSTLCVPEGLSFGSLSISTKPSTSDEESTGRRFTEAIPIRGTIIEGYMFSLSTQKITFKSLLDTSDYEGESDDENLSVPDSSNYISSRDASDDGTNSNNQQASIVISNLSLTFPLEFQVTLEGPMEYPAAEIIRISPLDLNNQGIVEAGQQLKLVVELIDPHVIISEDIKVFIRNLNSNNGQQQRVLVGIVSNDREHRKLNKKNRKEDECIDPHHHQNKLEEPSVSNACGSLNLLSNIDVDASIMQPVISLRGCKRIDSSDSAGGRFELDLGQQDMGSANILRKLVLENSTYDRVSYRIKTISSLDKNWLKISRLEGTLEPPADEQLSNGSSSTQTITLSFTTNVRNVFSTYLLIENVDNPADTKTIRITMEVVARQTLRRATKGNEPNNRVFDVIVNGIDYKNSSSIEMKNLYYGSEYTARSMVVYNREAVPMEFTFKSNLTPTDSTEILFSTSRTSAKLFKTLTVPSENHVRVYIRFFPKPSATIQEALDNGEYRDPDEMELKTVEIYINCRLVKDYQQIVTLTAECYLPAIRISWQDSISFVEYPEPDRVVEGLQTHEIRVVPNIKALLRNPETFRREKYVQENITIYNRNRPLENYWIPLRISFGNISNFQLSSGYKSSYAFGRIEQHVVDFLSDFNTHAVLVTMGSSNGFFSGSPTLGSGPKHGSSTSSVTGGGSGFSFNSVGFGPDRGPGFMSGSSSPTHTSPVHLLNNAINSGLPLLSPPATGPVAGMLGLGRNTSALTVYQGPSHHPHYQSPEAQETQRKLIDLEFKYRYVVDQLVYYSTIKTGENFFQLASLLFCTLLGNRIFQIWSPAYLKDPKRANSGGSNSANVGTSMSSTAGPSTEYDENGDRLLVQAGANGFTIHNHQRYQDETQIRVWPESLRRWVEALDYFVSFFPYHARQLETLKNLHHSLISS